VDGLRAVAVIAVIFHHGIGEARWAQPWLSARMSAQPAWWFATFASKGAHGVDLFFVISGFCPADPALERLYRGGATLFDVRRFLAKRIARIVPPYYIAIGVALAAALAADRLGLPRMAVFGGDHSPLAILKQLLFLDRGTVASAPSRFGTADDAGFFVQTNLGWQLASFCFVVAASEVAWLRRMLEGRFERAIGVAAYGIYLVHQPIVSWWSETSGTLVPPAVSFAAAVLLAIAGGIVFSFGAERPFLSGRARAWMLGALHGPLARFFAFAGLPATIDLARSAAVPRQAMMPHTAVSVERPIERAVS
jgi:peptidoglycan/LPS O-acetylase OafA/YrhL